MTYTNEYITRKRIRIGSWSNFSSEHMSDEYMKMYKDGGFDFCMCCTNIQGDKKEILLDAADKYGIEVLMTDYNQDILFSLEKESRGIVPFLEEHGLEIDELYVKDDIFEVIKDYKDRPSFGGHYLIDEIGSGSFKWVGKIANDYISKLPNKIPFINLLPNYANAAQLKFGANASTIEYYDSDSELYYRYCKEYCENINTSYICTDVYPLRLSEGKKITYSDYVQSFNLCARAAREYGKELWCFIQCNSRGDMPIHEQEYRWQSYTALSFGSLCILAWIYSGIVKGNTPLAAYYSEKPVFEEMQKISDIFIQYKNVGAFTYNCTDKTPYLKMSGEYKDFSAIKEIKCDQPLLFGCFDKMNSSGKAFTIVNMTDLAAEKPANVKLAIDGKVTSFYKGVAKTLVAENGYYEINLIWGDGVFITIDE